VSTFFDKVAAVVSAVVFATLLWIGNKYIAPIFEPAWRLLSVPEDLSSSKIEFSFRVTTKRPKHLSLLITFDREIDPQHSNILAGGREILVRESSNEEDEDLAACVKSISSKNILLESFDDAKRWCVNSGVTYTVRAIAADPKDNQSFKNTTISFGGEQDFGERFLRDGPTCDYSWLVWLFFWVAPILVSVTVVLLPRKHWRAEVLQGQRCFLKSKESYKAQLDYACKLYDSGNKKILELLDLLVNRELMDKRIRYLVDKTFLALRGKELDGAGLIYSLALNDFVINYVSGNLGKILNEHQAYNAFYPAIKKRAEIINLAIQRET